MEIRGRVASLLEVGTGFHPELTGRENIYLNGAILGMTRREIRSKFDEIVDFAEVEKFLDTPVKRYSSGMYVRLAFAVAAHLEPEILVVDEVLAVGDAEFQKKCIGKMNDASDGLGRTVIFISHSMDVLQKLCPRALLFKSGVIVDDGVAGDVIKNYMTTSNASSSYLHQGASVADAFVERALLVIGNGQSDFYENHQTISLDLSVSANVDCIVCVEILLRGQTGNPLLF